MTESLYEIPVNDEFINQILDKPEKFLVPDEKLEKKILGVTKNLFDFGIKNEDNSSCPLEELYIDGFDNEQIWEEIQLQNIPLIEQFNEISNDIIENDLQMSEEEEEEEEENYDDNEFNEVEENEDEEMENLNENEENEEHEFDEENNEDIMDDEDFSEDNVDNKGKSLNSNKKYKKTVVDDEFFSLREMEAFAEEFERKDILRSRRFNKEENGEEFDEDDEGMNEEDYEYMDFDQDFDDEDDDMEIRYEDFFAPPEEYEKNKNKGDLDNDKVDENKMDEEDKEEEEDDDDDEGEEGEEDDAEVEHGLDEDGFPNLHGNDDEALDNEDDEEENEEEEEEEEDDDDQNLTTKISNLFSEDNDEEEGEGETLSTFEKSQKKMQETIEKLEEEAIADKHWALKGEISSKARPLNSLLEEDLEVEHASKPVPVITEEVTQTLEDMIRQRILDNLFDDVERKIDINTLKPKYDPNKQFELFEEQKKQSLSEVYENEYLRQTAGEHQSEKELELEKRHQEIDELFKKLCQNLDALSNWHYAPKPAKMEMTVVSNVPTIQMEEVLPIHESENTLLAPEEAYEKPKTDVKGETEIDSGEKKRQRARRRKIKKIERKQREKEQKLRAKLLPNSISQKHANKKQALETLTGNKNVTIISNNSLNLPGGKKKKGNGAKVISTSGGKASSNENTQISLKL